MMTRKDYRVLADVMLKSLNEAHPGDQFLGVMGTMTNLVTRLESEYPNFDAHRFVVAVTGHPAYLRGTVHEVDWEREVP